jgi:hypothetical protein
VPGFAPAVMPVVHTLIQVQEDLQRLVATVPAERVWQRPGGAASIAFHVSHTGGALDRLFTYARGQGLSGEQRGTLAREGSPPEPNVGVSGLLNVLDAQVEHALAQLRATPSESLNQERLVGRQQLPSTVLGLLFHAAEHSQRHVGQMLVTARVQS